MFGATFIIDLALIDFDIMQVELASFFNELFYAKWVRLQAKSPTSLRLGVSRCWRAFNMRHRSCESVEMASICSEESAICIAPAFCSAW